MIPDPALVWLAGPAGAGKSTWAASTFAPSEVLSSDGFRAIAGSDESDLSASETAFTLLRIAARSRLQRGLMTVVDTVGTNLELFDEVIEAAGGRLPVVVVLFDTPEPLVRERNRNRARRVPARALDGQIRRYRERRAELEQRAAIIHRVGADHEGEPATAAAPARSVDPGRGTMLHLSSFDWVEDWAADLAAVAAAADATGFGGISVMDHLVQIPQVGRTWDPMPEAVATLGYLAGASSSLRLAVLVANVTLRHPLMLARSLAALDVLTGGRVDAGLGAGWYAPPQRDRAFEFPDVRDRFEMLEDAIGVCRAVWAPGGKPYRGTVWAIDDTASYPRPVQDPIPVTVGGRSRRAREIAVRHADEWNLSTSDPQVVGRLLDGFERPADRPFRVSVLDASLFAPDRRELAQRMEALRGNVGAADFRRRTRAGTLDHHAERMGTLAALGVDRVYVSPLGFRGVESVTELAPLVEAMARSSP